MNEQDVPADDEIGDGYDLNLIVQCRGCPKLLKAQGDWEDGEIVVKTTGAPIFGSCPSQKEFPPCSDKLAALIVASEEVE